ncbi:MAG: hypothetical protein Q7U10_01355 [Thermodesulfovibrionia bacterium]|nr:hypothetical protein [Thermodesulfovibrionia bacterium]
MNSSRLDNECKAFYQYLISGNPDKYVLEKYNNAHTLGSPGQSGLSNFDKVLLAVAQRGTFFTKLVDVYTTIFFKNAIFRKKLILLIAILESYAPVCYKLDSVTVRSKTIFFIKVFSWFLVFAFSLLIAVVLFMPLHVFQKFIPKADSY